MTHEAADVNKEVLARLGDASVPAPRRPVPTLFRLVRECEPEQVSFALGKLGEKLRAFAELVDFEHPDIGHAFDGVLEDQGDLAEECKELLLLAELARQHKLEKVRPQISTILKREIPKELLRKIDSPQVNRLNVRFLKSPEDRRKVRATKMAQVIDLRSVCRRGEDVWEAQPNGFRRFVRFNAAYQEEMQKVEKKAQRYLELGCTGMHAEVVKSLEAFKTQVQESYYGFNRITMTHAAVVLAKSLGYRLHQPYLLSDIGHRREYRIVADRFLFKDYMFGAVEAGGDMKYAATRRPETFAYEPRVYPLHDLWSCAPPDVVKIIEQLEAFPEAGGRPIFDHFGVIVPSVRYPDEAKGRRYNVVDEHGLIRSYDVREIAQTAVDLAMIKCQQFWPAVVAEKDGRCYFICYWA